MHKRRAQATTEFLAIFGIALVIFLIIFVVSQGQNETISAKKLEIQAANSAGDLANAARQVHAQGRGARVQLSITLPRSYDAAKSSIGQRAIRISAAGTDYSEQLDFDVQGALPQSFGTSSIILENQGLSVFIGINRSLDLNRSAIGNSMLAGTSYSEDVRLTNLADDSALVLATPSWNTGQTSLTVVPPSASIAGLASAQFRITVSATGAALGGYAGSVNFSTGAGNGQYLVLPVFVDVVS